MSQPATLPDLDGARLRIPSLPGEPLELRAVEAAPCTRACPAGINVKAYVSLIAEGRFAEALEVVRRRCPLPGICGRVCHHPCEAACRRSEIDDPLAIRALKRFVADLELEPPERSPAPGAARSERVAVIGSGPAGLTAAYDLRLAGYPVTVYEAAPEPGGMLRYGIADYRLPPEILDAEIAWLESAGVKIRTGCRIGHDIELEELLAEGYSAVLFAVGAQLGRRLGIPGESGCAEVEDAISWLRRVNLGERHPLRGHVLVIGGGSTAIEAARASRRLGAERVEILYRRTREEMPASDQEIEEAQQEGVELRFLVTPKRILRRGARLRGIECLRNRLGEPDTSGRRRPEAVPGSEFRVPADRILTAIGQSLDLDFLPQSAAARLVGRGRLRVDEATRMTPLQGVFAAGDAVTGPATVIEAVAAGHRVAESIRSYLRHGKPVPVRSRPAATEYALVDPPPPTACRLEPPRRPMAAGTEFAEVELAFDPDSARSEAGRCLRCGGCSECVVCAPGCSRRHLLLRPRQQGEGDRGAAVWLRGPARVTLALPRRAATRAQLSTAPGPVPVGEPVWSDVELLPARVGIEPALCRGCSRCRDVCPFDAVRLLEPEDPESKVRIEPSLCRGCNLCVSVCPTGAASPSAFAADEWVPRLPPAEDGAETAGRLLVVTCQRRADRVVAALEPYDLEVVRLRCVGQVDAGLLLELHRRRAAGILVAGCLAGSCRFDGGATLAARQVAIARAMLDRVGAGEPLVADWLGDSDGAGADPVVLDWIAAASADPPERKGGRAWWPSPS